MSDPFYVKDELDQAWELTSVLRQVLETQGDGKDHLFIEQLIARRDEGGHILETSWNRLPLVRLVSAF